MLNKALEAFGDLGDDEELGPADWPTVKKYIASLNNVEGGPVHPHSGTESDNLDDMNLEDIRIRLLNGKYYLSSGSSSCIKNIRDREKSYFLMRERLIEFYPGRKLLFKK